MTPEERSMLEQAVALAKENNSILRKLRRAHRVSTGIKIVYWVIIIGLAVGSYYVIQPIIDSLTGIYGGGVENIQNLQDSTGLIKDLWK